MANENGILTGPMIAQEVERGRITIDPYNPKRINPASIDLTLGNKVSVYLDTVSIVLSLVGGQDQIFPGDVVEALDSKQEWPTEQYTFGQEGFVLRPGIGYLMHTAERVLTDHYVPVLDGKSSVGRAFIKVHETAGYGDPGFDGQYTLEVTCQFPVRVYPGMRFCQMRFHTMVGDPLLYHGNYRGEASMGPVPSRLHRQFEV